MDFLASLSPVDLGSLLSIRTWLDNPWLGWGLALYVAANVGFWVPAAVLEWAVRQDFARGSLITYAQDGASSRAENIAASRRKQKNGVRLDWPGQLRTSAAHVAGPLALLSTMGASPLISRLAPPPPAADYPSAAAFVAGLVAMELVGDFLLYWGHRVQHTNQFLWDRFHSFHHAIDTPTAVSTVCINGVDAFLQASLPMILAILVCRAHPLTCWVYLALRVGENVVNHSGIDAAWLNAVALKTLPLRAGVRHHDSHHRFSNYAGDAKNYGENFWIWDYAFGTYADTAPKKTAR
ncbi:Methylsterol monooxygenase 1-2 [Diplonema papillatum]|nr:Methylsterol monooxygenase 1-2 [Diplonema papillatum]